MSTEENKKLVRRYYDLYNQENIEALREIMDPDFVCHIGGSAEPIRGLDTNLKMESYMRSAFSDIRFTVLDMVAEGDMVAVRRTWSLKHTGEYEGIPPSGKELTGTAAEFFRIANGKIVESWTESDNLSFMQKLGAIPAYEGAETSGL